MARAQGTTPDVILRAVIQRLIDAVPQAEEANTYASTISRELPPNPSDVMFEVALAHNFSEWQPEITGAGNEGLHTIMSVMVTISTTIQQDEVGHDLLYLTDTQLGVCHLMTDVLAALSMYDPKDEAGEEILAQPMRPTSGQLPPKDDRSRGYVTLLFEVEFDWLLPEVA